MAFKHLKHFLDTFGEPRPKRAQIIPDRYRIPFYLALSVLSLLVLILLVQFVVRPGIEAQKAIPNPSRPELPTPQERTQ